MAKERILVVDDEEDLQELLRYNLDREGYAVTCASSGEEALSEIRRKPPDLIVLDRMLPGIDGFEVCRKLRRNAQTARIPIIILTAKGEDADIVAGLELGANDYVTKPFSPAVLVARIRTLLRRREAIAATGEVIRIHDLTIDRARHQVLVGKKSVALTATEFGLLVHLASQPGWVFTRSQLIDATKGSDYAVTERSIDVQVAGLRKKLGAAGKEVETVRGIGYRFREE